MTTNSDILTNSIYDLISKVQRYNNDLTYTEKTPRDKILCVLCGKKYSRKCKSSHIKSTHHRNCLALLNESICENLKGVQL